MTRREGEEEKGNVRGDLQKDDEENEEGEK